MRSTLVAATIAAATIAAQPALADPTNYTLAIAASSPFTDDIAAYVGNEYVYVGPINMAVTNQSTSSTIDQLVFCTDTAYNFNSGTYTLGSLSTGLANAALTGQQTEAIRALLQHTSITADVNNDAAIQGAIWTIEDHVGSESVTTVVTGGGATFESDADTMLTSLYTTWINGTITASVSQYIPTSPANNQSFGFLSVSGNSNAAPLPEPTSLALLTAGLFGLAGLRRRA